MFRLRLFFILAWLSAVCACGWVELARLKFAIASPSGWLGWFANWDADTTPAFLILMALPVLIVVRFRSASLRGMSAWRKAATASEPPRESRSERWIPAGLFLVSLLCSASIGMRTISVPTAVPANSDSSEVCFFALPPAYHDEFSYLLQARTFLAGRVTWPAMTVHPELFHQIHVLNEPMTASRYFPWTGLWMAPFVLCRCPYAGHWLAGALAVVFFHGCLTRLLPRGWALCGGLLIALSPGLAVFSNLLLAHHPTMLALSVFLWAFLRLMKSAADSDALIAGTALTLAMLGRPMTAAGFALPFGIWLLVAGLRSTIPRRVSSVAPRFGWRAAAAIGLPLLAGFIVLGAMNQRITGRWTQSAYQLYTDTYTPSHRFGFNNAEIGAKLAGPKVLNEYDRWATNLTPAKAAENVRNRCIASTQWTLGIAALVFALIAAIPSCLPLRGNDIRIVLILCSVTSLHAVHVPYWYDGILHWHYVFETAPLLLILATVGLRNAFTVMAGGLGTKTTLSWLTCLIGASLLPGWMDAETFWGPSKVTLAVGEQSFSRVRFEQFRRLTRNPELNHPVLVMVDESASDPQLSYIVNPPDLQADVLVCRKPAEVSVIAELKAAFPDRSLWVFNPETFALQPWMD